MQNEDQRPPNPEQDAAKQPVEDWKAKADEYKDKWLRSAADLDNYIKRQQRDRQRQELEIRIRVLKRLLPTLDDFERALKNKPVELVDHPWVKGVLLIERKLRSILDDFQVKDMEVVGKPFDPNYHEALMTEASDQPEGTILEELAKGYMLEDQVVRVAAVKTSSGPVKTSNEANPKQEENING